MVGMNCHLSAPLFFVGHSLKQTDCQHRDPAAIPGLCLVVHTRPQAGALCKASSVAVLVCGMVFGLWHGGRGVGTSALHCTALHCTELTASSSACCSYQVAASQGSASTVK